MHDAASPNDDAIRYGIEPHLELDEFVSVLVRSTLAERRPIDEPETLAAMLANAGLIVAARNGAGLLVGVSRAITDFAYCTYLSDLAVDQAYQEQGIGRELIRRTHEAAGFHTTLILAFRPQSSDVLSAHRHAESRFVLGDRPRFETGRRVTFHVARDPDRSMR
ncbi:MAG: GNAT family N-acetyltransferase [Pirellulales bacterium]